MNEKRFTAGMKALAVNAGVELPKDVLTLYFRALKHIPDQEFEQGIKSVLLSWEYNRIPPLAVIIKAIKGDPKRQIEDQAEIQATYIISCIGKENPNFNDMITACLMSKRWKWSTWASAVLESELKWWVKDFKEAYRAFSGPDTPLQIEAPPELIKLTADIGV